MSFFCFFSIGFVSQIDLNGPVVNKTFANRTFANRTFASAADRIRVNEAFDLMRYSGAQGAAHFSDREFY